MSLKKRIKKWIHSKHMLSGIGVVSFMESTVVPIPLETIMLPLMQARREKLWLIALSATLGCLVGALIFYLVGFFLFDTFQSLIFEHLTTEAQFTEFQRQMDKNGFLFIFSTGVTPIPLQVATLAAGFSGYSVSAFIIATALGRIARYFGLAILVYYLGDKAERAVRKYKWKVAYTLLVLLIFAAIAINYL